MYSSTGSPLNCRTPPLLGANGHTTLYSTHVHGYASCAPARLRSHRAQSLPPPVGASPRLVPVPCSPSGRYQTASAVVSDASSSRWRIFLFCYSRARSPIEVGAASRMLVVCLAFAPRQPPGLAGRAWLPAHRARPTRPPLLGDAPEEDGAETLVTVAAAEPRPTGEREQPKGMLWGRIRRRFRRQPVHERRAARSSEEADIVEAKALEAAAAPAEEGMEEGGRVESQRDLCASDAGADHDTVEIDVRGRDNAAGGSSGGGGGGGGGGLSLVEDIAEEVQAAIDERRSRLNSRLTSSLRTFRDEAPLPHLSPLAAAPPLQRSFCRGAIGGVGRGCCPSPPPTPPPPLPGDGRSSTKLRRRRTRRHRLPPAPAPAPAPPCPRPGRPNRQARQRKDKYSRRREEILDSLGEI